MSNYSEADFCTKDEGLDYIFANMGAIYGATFNRHFEGMGTELIRGVWKGQVGNFLTYKPSLDYALTRLSGDFVPSAIKFRDFCNAGPEIPKKPVLMIEKKLTLHEKMELDRVKAESLAKLKLLKDEYKRGKE